MTSKIVLLKDYRKPKPSKRQKQKSQYELYPLPFFDGKTLCTWAAKPSGDYTADCEVGRKYAVAFLQSCDGTVGWSSLLAPILADMFRAGHAGVRPDESIRLDGIMVGFMSTIGKVLAVSYMNLSESTRQQYD
jgi:hypothetical protein